MMSELFLEYFQLKLEDILFFSGGLRLFLGFFGLRKAVRPFEGQKIQKRPKASRKKNVLKFQLKKVQKKLTHHENKPAFFLSLVPYHVDAHSSMILYISEKST